jgi:hypothetical protein
MAVTGLRIEQEEGTQNMLVSTMPFEAELEGGHTKEGIAVDWQVVDDDLKPIGEPEKTAHERTEEEFHKTLREEAAKAGHLITGWSSDPEWNPEGYTKIFNKDGSM